MQTFYEQMTDEKKAEYEAAVKERFAKKGFDPDDMWAWKLRLFGGKPVTLREFQQVLGEAKRRGWMDEGAMGLEYGLYPVDKDEDFPLPGYDWEIRAWPNFGSNEGIYLDWEITIFKPNNEREKKMLHCAKTLGEGLDDMEMMSLLCGRILWLCREIPCC